MDSYADWREKNWWPSLPGTLDSRNYVIKSVQDWLRSTRRLVLGFLQSHF